MTLVTKSIYYSQTLYAVVTEKTVLTREAPSYFFTSDTDVGVSVFVSANTDPTPI